MDMSLMDGKKGLSTSPPLTSMRSTLIDMLVKILKLKRSDLQHGKRFFLQVKHFSSFEIIYQSFLYIESYAACETPIIGYYLLVVCSRK